MTRLEFNTKYANNLATGFYGLAINNEDVVNYLDRRFQEFIKLPDFKYYQIKMKYGFSSVYCDGLTEEEIYQLELGIQDILDESYKKD